VIVNGDIQELVETSITSGEAEVLGVCAKIDEEANDDGGNPRDVPWQINLPAKFKDF